MCVRPCVEIVTERSAPPAERRKGTHTGTLQSAPFHPVRHAHTPVAVLQLPRLFLEFVNFNALKSSCVGYGVGSDGKAGEHVR